MSCGCIPGQGKATEKLFTGCLVEGRVCVYPVALNSECGATLVHIDTFKVFFYTVLEAEMNAVGSLVFHQRS